MKKRLLAFFLAFAMVFTTLLGIMPVTAFAISDTDQIVTVEKYDAEGNGTFLLMPKRVSKISSGYGNAFVPKAVGSENITLQNDCITAYIDDTQDDGWLNNGDIVDTSKWLASVNGTVYEDTSWFYANEVKVLRIILSTSGDGSEFGLGSAGWADLGTMSVNKDDLIELVSRYAADDFAEGTAQASAYQTALDTILDLDATADQVSAAKTGLENSLSSSATGISLSSESLTVLVGRTSTVTATLVPATATDTITWSIADETIATVDQSGTVTGVAAGTTTLTAKVSDTVSASIPVTVKEVGVTGIQLKDVTMNERDILQLTATLVPNDATGTVTWSVADETIAAITEDGIVTALKAGQTTVTAAIGEVSGSATLTVTAGPYIYFEYNDGRENQYMAADSSFTLGALDEGFFRIANTTATAWWENEEKIDAGNGSVTYHWYVNRETGEWQPSGLAPTKPIVVTAGDFTQEFTINYEATSGVTQLKTYIDGTEVTDDAPYEVTGCVSNVAVTTKGLKNGEWIDVPVQALNYDTSDNVYYNFRFVGNCLEINRAGTATMTVSLKGESVSTTFGVKCNPVKAEGMKVTVPETFAIAEWDAVPDQYVGIRPFSEGGYSIEFTPANATNRDVTWTAQNPDIAEHYTTHSAGIVPKKAGTAKFTVTNVEDPLLTQDVTVTFTYQNPLTAAASGETSYTMEAGQTQELTITATPSDATEQRFDWTYSKDGIVSVTDKIKTSEDGLSYWTTHTISALKAGTVTVTGTPWDTTGGCESVTFTVTVNRDPSIALESVTVKTGDSVSYTDTTGDYSGTDLTDLNTSVATIELESETATVAVGNIWTSSGGVNGGQVDISECLYTFTQNEDGSWTITGTDADGNTVYLYPGNGKDSGTDAGYPNTKNPPEGMTISFEDGYFTNSFRIKSSTDVWNEGVGAYLYFNSSEHTWNRSRTATTVEDQKRVSFFLFREAADGETSSATFPGTMETIPGYVAVTSIDELTSGGEYLIAAVNEGWSQWYTAYPSAVTDSKYAQVAAVASGTKIVTNITITGVAAGKTSATIGSTEYAIKVVNDLSALPSEWPSFRGNDKNNGVTSAATPRTAAETNEKWVNQISTSWSDAPSPMILVDDTVVTMAGSTLYKLSTDTGATVASATMTAATSWGTTPPIYADGYIFCQLGGGTVQAFNADTLESLWVYTDDNGGQAQSPIAYSDGMVYVGFGYGNEYAFVCLDANDGELMWRDVDSQGYYWAGAVVVGDYVVCGTDGGSIISRDKLTGEVKGTLEVGNKIRSSICYDKVGSRIYFADYAANLCYAQLNTNTGAMRNLIKVDCSAYGSYSTSTPVVYEGIAYIGVGGWSGNKSIVAVNVGGVDTDDSILWAIDEPAYPQCSVLLSTAYVDDDGYIYLYTTYNNNPGGINVIKAKADGSEATQETLYTPASDYQEYCICSVIADSDGTLYYKNDSGAIFALEYQAPTYTVTLPEDEGYTVTGETTVTGGEDYTFTVTVSEGYEATEDFAVMANGEALTANEDGSYTVAGVSEDLTITVEGVVKASTEPETPFISIVTDTGADVTTKFVEMVPAVTDWATYNDGPYYHVTVPAGTESVLVTYPESVSILGSPNAYSYTLSVPDYTLGYGDETFAVTENDDGSHTVTIPVANYLLAEDGTGTGMSLEDSSTYDPITFFTFAYEKASSHTVTLTAGTGYTLSGETTVEDGADYSFSLTIANYYMEDKDFAVKANGVALDAASVTSGTYNYVVKNVTEDVTITVEGVSRYYKITLPTAWSQFTLSAYGDYPAPSSDQKVIKGDDYKFTVTPNDGYAVRDNDYNVSFSGSFTGSVEAMDGYAVITLSEVYSNGSVTINGCKQIMTVTLPEAETYTVIPAESNYDPILEGDTYTFSLSLAAGYQLSNGAEIKAGDTVLTADASGSYSFTVNEDTVITVTGVEAVPTVTHTVILPTDDTYTATPCEGYSVTVSDGGSFQFTVVPVVGYGYGESFAVKANGTVLTADDSGIYTVENITEDVNITVDGVEQIIWEPVSVYFSFSQDDAYEFRSNTAIALKEVEVPYFDLALYDLTDFYFSSETYGDDGDGLPGSALDPGTAQYAYGKVTMLHLFIYATEVYYCDIDPEDAGQGYLFNQGLMGTDTFNITGSAGSSYLKYIWGYDENLNYYLNYEYPLASEGWGSTSDQILLHDGDIVTLGHFTDWSFWTDSAKGFNFIETSKSEPTQGEEITLTLYRAGEGENYTTINTQITSCPKVYYALADSIPSGDVTTWNELGTAASDGTLTVNTSKLAPGEYIFAIAGQPGADTTAICSTPGGVRVTVKAGQGSTVVMGDVNGDGQITARDASLIYNIVNNNEEITDDLLAVADVNGDGDITARDAQLVYNYANGVITSFS